AFFDIGDFLHASGKLFKTKHGEKTVEVKTYGMLAKSLRPLPEKRQGLKDVEERLRRRYLDLLMNLETRELFRKKSQFWASVRTFMMRAGFLEVETPVLEAVPGGADAEPFVTHLNALDIDLYLRISLELPLKRLLVGGYEKVFEIGRIFRNEGIDATHLQDYTQLEFYWAYQDVEGLMKFVRDLYQTAVRTVRGSLTSIWGNTKIEWGGTWPQLDYYELFQKHLRLNLKTASRQELLTAAKKEGLKLERWVGRGRLIDQLFKKHVLPKLIQPAFLLNPPADIEPLAKRLPQSPDRVGRVQVVGCGMELGKGFSELNDPLDQRARFEGQMKLREKGDREAQRLDEDFVEALEYGMPPAAGFGMSERLFAVLMNTSVRETVFFPLMRPK
ncbi:lysine--tRNA ligase, partial [Candidatus Azambacteria bacterium]|nr:lysine--tRNA ligase [Candidatus Azambacteria bacterium]